MTDQARAVAQRLREINHGIATTKDLRDSATTIEALCAEVEQRRSSAQYDKECVQAIESERDELLFEVDRLRGALIYHQEQTRPIQRTIDVLEGTK